MKQNRLLFAVLCCGSIFASCQKEPSSGSVLDGGALTFRVDTDVYESGLVTKSDLAGSLDADGGPTLYLSSWSDPMGGRDTKSAPVTSLYNDRFGLFGYLFDAASSFAGTEKPLLCHNLEVKKLASGVWTSTAQTLYYPGASYKMRLYAYSPYNGDGVTVASSSTDGGAPVLAFKQKADVASQIDLLESQSADIAGDSETGIDLTFTHSLSGIKVKFASFGAEVTVKSVKFSNLYSSGNHALGSGTWTNLGDLTSWTVSEDLTVPVSGGSETFSEANTILTVPQTCVEDAAMEIVLSQSGIEYKYKTKLSGLELKQGYITTITLSLSSSDILAAVAETSSLSDFTNTTSTASQTLTVKAFSLYNNGLKAPAPWSMEFSTDGSAWSTTKPDWITLSKTSGNGSLEGESVTVTAGTRSLGADEPDAESQARVAVLQGRSSLGSSSSPVDLSMRDYNGDAVSGRSTANCYIVHQAGYYKFPLAYGNAVKNGVTNTEAFYTSVATGFEDADGNTFTASSSPYLADGTYSMEVLWNDTEVPFTLSASSVSVDGVPYAEFSIPQSGIKEGNILIAAKKDGVVKWSWHIWVSGADFTPEVITNSSSVNFSIMPIDLGWCGMIAPGYPERSCYLRIKTVSGVSDPVAVRQAFVAGSGGTTYAALYYQWGRKDPFIGMGIAPSADGKISYVETSSTGRMYEAHQNPTTHYNNNNYGPTNSSYAKNWFWDSKCSGTSIDQKPTKTIYDPCPAGWTVPQYNTFTGFSTSNVVGSFDKGWYFKRNSGDTEGLFFPAFGYRIYDSASLYDVGSYGCRWLSVPLSGNGGRCLYFSSSSVDPQNSYSRAYGYGVRPALEN